VWTTDRQKWVVWVENHVDNDPTLELTDVIDDYDLDEQRYEELLQEAT